MSILKSWLIAVVKDEGTTLTLGISALAGTTVDAEAKIVRRIEMLQRQIENCV
jgi:hypothetical protein